jgi:hypothetical protein
MKNILIVLSILLITLISFSCGKKKSQTTIVSGKVINFGSRAPVEGVLVILQDGVDASNGSVIDGKTSSDKKNTAYTNSNGEFRVELKGEYQPFLGLKKKVMTLGTAMVGLQLVLNPTVMACMKMKFWK